MQLIDGKATAAQIKAEIAEEVKQIVESGGKRPHLAAILVGHDGGSETYVRNKVLACEACGFKSTLLRFEDTISEEELLAEVDKLNKDEDVDGFIVQLPLPAISPNRKSSRPSTSARTWTVSTPSTWEEWLSGFLVTSQPPRKASWNCSGVTMSRRAARNVSSWAAATS